MMWLKAAGTVMPSGGNAGAPLRRGLGLMPSASYAMLPLRGFVPAHPMDSVSASDTTKVRTIAQEPPIISRVAGRSAATARRLPSNRVIEMGSSSIVSGKTERLPSNAATGVVASGSTGA